VAKVDTKFKVQSYKDEVMIRFGSNMVSVAVWIWKPEISSATVFCVHAFGGSGQDFELLAAVLASNGLMVICPDMPGRGDSARLKNPKLYSLLNYAKCMSAVFQQYGNEQSYFVGNGWGGIILLVWLNASTLKNGKLIVADVPLRWALERDRQLTFATTTNSPRFESLAAARKFVLSSGEFDSLPEGLLEKFVARRLRKEDGAYCLNYDSAIVQGLHKFEAREIDMQPLFRRQKLHALLLYASSLAVKERTALEALAGSSRRIRYIDGLATSGHLHFATLKEILITLGFFGADSG
jgi:pimeloyl-ACP methyl ester carboxylesterase